MYLNVILGQVWFLMSLYHLLPMREYIGVPWQQEDKIEYGI